MKRGQITLFIIMGIVLVLMIAGFFIIRSRLENAKVMEEIEKQKDFETSVNAIDTYVQTCVDNAAVASIKFLGLIGSESPAGRYDYGADYPAAYLRDSSNNYLPGLDEWEETLSAYTGIGLEVCDFKTFEDQGFTIEKGRAMTDVTINYDNVIFDVQYPLKVSRSENSQDLTFFRSTVPARLGYVHEVVNTLIEDTLADSDKLDLTLLLSFDVNVTVASFKLDKTLVYQINDENPMYESFMFAYADKE